MLGVIASFLFSIFPAYAAQEVSQPASSQLPSIELQKSIALYDRYSKTIHASETSNRIEDIAQLIKDGTEITQEDADGITPFHLALIYGTDSLIEMLLKKSHDCRLQQIYQEGQWFTLSKNPYALRVPALDALIRSKHTISELRKRLVLFIACSYPSEQAKEFVQRAIPLINEYMKKAKMFLDASSHDDFEGMLVQLKQGVNPNVLDDRHRSLSTPLSYALMGNRHAISKLLLEYGACFRPRMLYDCLEQQKYESAQLMLEKGLPLVRSTGPDVPTLGDGLYDIPQEVFFRTLAQSSLCRYLKLEPEVVRAALHHVWVIVYEVGIKKGVPPYVLWEICSRVPSLVDDLTILAYADVLNSGNELIKTILVDSILATEVSEKELPSQIRLVKDKFAHYVVTLLAITRGYRGIGSKKKGIYKLIRKKLYDDLSTIYKGDEVEIIFSNFGDCIEPVLHESIRQYPERLRKEILG